MTKTNDRPYAEFGKQLKALRLKGSIITQRELADRLGDLGVHYDYTLVSHWETGRRLPSLETLVAIIQVLVEAGSIKRAEEANELLRLSHMRNLSETEISQVFGEHAATARAEFPVPVLKDDSRFLTPASVVAPLPISSPTANFHLFDMSGDFLGEHTHAKSTVDGEASGAFIPGAAPPPPTLMVGRGDAMAEMRVRLTGEASTTLLSAVRGWPGIGKTTLAAALAHDAKLKKVFSDGVLWVALGPDANPNPPLGEWLTALGVDPGDLPTLEGRSNRLAALLRNRKMLLIVDDVWDAADAQPFCVGGHACRTLITTRHPEVARGLGLPDQAIFCLQVLTDKDALTLLRQLAPLTVDMEPEGTHQLVRALEGLPLALQVAGRLLAAETAMGWGISDLLAELAEGTRILKEKAPADLTDLSNQTTPTVAVLLQKSTNRLDDVTRDRFALLGAFVPKPATFDGEAVAAVWEVEDPRPTLRTLVARGLLEPAMEGRFQMHALLAVHARALCGE